MMDTVLLACGLLIGLFYVALYTVGGALRPGYSHIGHSVSELLAPGSPHRQTLATIQVIYALLHVAFGCGVLLEVLEMRPSLLGAIGAWAIVAVGIATLGTAVFPQDATGTPETTAGKIHKALVFGVLVPASILSTLLIGLWSRDVGALAGFSLYSYITVGAIAVMGAIGGAAVKTRYAGLAERVAALVTHQWLFVLAIRLLLR